MTLLTICFFFFFHFEELENQYIFSAINSSVDDFNVGSFNFGQPKFKIVCISMNFKQRFGYLNNSGKNCTIAPVFQQFYQIVYTFYSMSETIQIKSFMKFFK